MERLENELCCISLYLWALLILQPFCHINYATTHSPTLPSLYLRLSSFSNPSVASPTSQFIFQPFFRFSYVTGSSPTSQIILQYFRCFTYVTAHSPSLSLLHLRHSSFCNPSFASLTSQALHLPTWRASHATWKGDYVEKWTKVSATTCIFGFCIIIKINKSVVLQLRRAKTDWSDCCQMAVKGALWLSKRLSLNLNFSFLNRISLLLISSSYPIIVLTRLGGPRSTPYTSRKISRVKPGIEPGTSWMAVRLCIIKKYLGMMKRSLLYGWPSNSYNLETGTNTLYIWVCPALVSGHFWQFWIIEHQMILYMYDLRSIFYYVIIHHYTSFYY